MPKPRGVVLGILGGGVPPILQILTLFQKRKYVVTIQIRTPTKESFFKSVLNLHIFVLVSYSFGIEFPETIIRSFTPLVSSITIPDPRPKLNGQSLYPFSDQNAAKTIPFGAGTYLYGFMIGGYLPGCSRGLVVDTIFLSTGTVNGPTTKGAYQLGGGGRVYKC